MKAASTKKESEGGCAGSSIVVAPRAWSKSRRKPALGNKLWLSRTSVQALDADVETASCALRLFRGRRGRAAPFFQGVKTALVDYRKEAWARCPSSSLSGPCTQRHSSGSGYHGVYKAWCSSGLEDGRSRSVPPPSSTGIDMGSSVASPDVIEGGGSEMLAASGSGNIPGANDSSRVELPVDSRSSRTIVSFAKIKTPRFQFAESDEHQACQLATSCRRTHQQEGHHSTAAWTSVLKAVQKEKHEELRPDSGDEENDDDDNSESHLTHFQAYDFARRLNLPMGEVSDAWRKFKRYDSGHRGRLSQQEYQLLIRSTLREHYPHAKDIPRELFTRNMADVRDVDVGFSEFLTWLSQHAFSEAILLSPEKQLLRAKARELQVSIPVVEHIRQVFAEFDTNSDCVIDYQEFSALFLKLMVCQSVDMLPDARIRTFWMQIEGSGSGLVKFDAFLSWYLRFFDKTGAPLGASPLEDYYESIRPCPKISTTSSFL